MQKDRTGPGVSALLCAAGQEGGWDWDSLGVWGSGLDEGFAGSIGFNWMVLGTLSWQGDILGCAGSLNPVAG